MLIRDQAGRAVAQESFASLIGPYEEEAKVELSCELELGGAGAGEPQAAVSWWQLSGISMPPTFKSNYHNQQVSQELLLTTMHLSDHDARRSELEELGPLEERRWFAGSGRRDYFVALKARTNVHQLTLPFLPIGPSANSYRLRHWLRVPAQLVNRQDETVSSTISIGQLSRFNLGDEYLCLASNLAEELVFMNKTVEIDMNRKFSS